MDFHPFIISIYLCEFRVITADFKKLMGINCKYFQQKGKNMPDIVKNNQ